MNNSDNNDSNNIQNNTQHNGLNIDLEGWGILLAMFLKVFGLVPIVVKIAQTKSAEDISLATPIMFLIAFFLLAIISFKKAFYVPLGLFAVGIAVSVVLIVQKILYENSKSKEEQQINAEIEKQHTTFNFPDPNLPNNDIPNGIYSESF